MSRLLPPALQPWAALLTLLPDDIAPQVGEWVRRLAPTIGPLRLHQGLGRDDPAGWDGLSRRGQPEQLLITEWGLADVLPEEFDRRAAMGEQMYLQREIRAPRVDQLSQVWFDCGPQQLGAPRVAQLALLLVLARRAEWAGARLRWGCLPGGQQFDAVDAASLAAWLNARSATPPAALPDVLPTADHWVIGHRPARFGTPRWVDIAEDLTADAPTLTLHIHAPQPRELKLLLPDDAVMTRLLRDPLPGAAANFVVRAGSGPGGKPVWLKFGGAGSKLLVGYENGAVAAYPIPNRPGDKAGRWREFSRYEQRVIAGDAVGKQIVALTRRDSDGQLFLHHAPGRDVRWSTQLTIDPGFELPLVGQLTMIVNVSQRVVYLIDQKRTLWKVDTRQITLSTTMVRRRILDAALFMGRFVCACTDPVTDEGRGHRADLAEIWVHGPGFEDLVGVLNGNTNYWETIWAATEHPSQPPFFHWHANGRRPSAMIMVGKRSAGDPMWQSLTERHQTDSGFFVLGEDHLPLGVVTTQFAKLACGITAPDDGADAAIAILKYTPADRTFCWATATFNGLPPLLTSPNPIQFAVFSPHTDYLAWLDDSRRLCAWSLRQRAMLLDITLKAT